MSTTVAFVSQKGGVSKSTLARALAREGAKCGLSVKIADLDVEQFTSTEWLQRRIAAGIEPTIQVELFATAGRALELAGQFDLLILDGPARASKGTLDIANAADLVIQPTGPSFDDMNPAIRVFHALVKSGVPKSRLVFALSRVASEPEIRSARDYLTEAGYAVLDGAVYEQKAYRKAQDGGYAITETRYETLNRSADRLLQDLINRIGG